MMMHSWPLKRIVSWGFARRLIVLRVDDNGVVSQFGIASKHAQQISEALTHFTTLRQKGLSGDFDGPHMYVAQPCLSPPDPVLGDLIDLRTFKVRTVSGKVFAFVSLLEMVHSLFFFFLLRS